MLLNKFGNRISNPHVRGLAQSGVTALSQAGYGRYCSKYGPRKCVKLHVKELPDGKFRYNCSNYTKRTCAVKRVNRPRRKTSAPIRFV